MNLLFSWVWAQVWGSLHEEKRCLPKSFRKGCVQVPQVLFGGLTSYGNCNKYYIYQEIFNCLVPASSLGPPGQKPTWRPSNTGCGQRCAILRGLCGSPLLIQTSSSFLGGSLVNPSQILFRWLGSLRPINGSMQTQRQCGSFYVKRWQMATTNPYVPWIARINFNLAAQQLDRSIHLPSWLVVFDNLCIVHVYDIKCSRLHTFDPRVLRYACKCGCKQRTRSANWEGLWSWVARIQKGHLFFKRNIFQSGLVQ